MTINIVGWTSNIDEKGGKGGKLAEKPVFGAVKGTYCENIQHLVASASKPAFFHRLLYGFHYRQLDVES